MKNGGKRKYEKKRKQRNHISCVSSCRNYFTKPSPKDKGITLVALVVTIGEAFVNDLENINNGYPIFNWQ